jgi:glycerol kinase
MSQLVLSLDQGTTSSRSILFGHDGRAVAQAQREFPQLYPSPGHVEHDPEQIWQTQISTARRTLKAAKVDARALAAIGITNQRETVVLWDRDTGKPVDNAIVWQSRITAPMCERLKRAGHEEMVRAKTGLVIDAYFSGTKIRHLLDEHKLQARARRGQVLAGTIDTFLLWRLTGGAVHATDPSNASRTMLYDIRARRWDPELSEMLGVPIEMLPEVRDSSGDFGETDKKLLGAAVPVAGIAGDQQAATFGQGCFKPGMAKSTYGTGAFILMNTGDEAVASKSGLLTTIGWSIDGKVTYCLEGSVFIAGAAVQWLRDGLGLIKKSSDVEKLAASVEDSGGVIMVPAFVGLGTPHWDPYARGLLIGLERSTTAAHVARATVESMAFQVRDVVTAMEADSGVRLRELRVDGGASVNAALMQFQADLLGRIVRRPVVSETTALGAAYLAGLAVGFWKNTQDVTSNWALDAEFRPALTAARRERQVARWQKAVERAKGWAEA